jgi:SSS family solute:Na+ symporter
MDLATFIVSALLLQIVCAWVGKHSSQTLKNAEDYYLSGKSVSFFPLMMTFVATQVGGGLVLGSATEAFRFGYWVLLYPLGQVLGFLCLGLGVGKKLSQFNVSTVAEIFEVAYGSPLLKKFASLLSIVSLFMILVAQVLASQQFLSALGVDQPLFFFLLWMLLIAYTAIGGMKAVISTDKIQVGFFVAVFLLAFSAAWIFPPSISPSLGTIPLSPSLSKLTGWFFMPLLFTFIEQDMGQRCFAAKSASVLKRATFVAALVTFLICLIPLYFGQLAPELGIHPSTSKCLFIASVSAATSPFIAALTGTAVIAAILSTADSLINAIGSNISNDFFRKEKDSSLASKETLRKTQWLSTLVGVSALFVSLFFDNIVELLIQSYELSVVFLFVPLVAALVQPKRRLFSALLSMVFGATAFVAFRLWPSPFPREVGAVGASLLGYAIGEGIVYIRSKIQTEVA